MLLIDSTRRLLTVVPLAWLTACVFVPRTTQVFDRDCQVVSNRMVLEPVQIAAIQRCSNDSCIAFVVAAGVTAAASAIVSGTIVVVGNVAYWFEKQSNCRRASTAPDAIIPASAESPSGAR